MPARATRHRSNVAKRALQRSGDNRLLFDERPLEIDGFRLHARSAEAIGRPSLEQFAGALEFSVSAQEASPYWVGDLWNYGEGRADWREKLEQQIRSTSGHTHKTLINLGYIARSVAPAARAIALSPAHAAEVAPLTPGEQIEWLEKTRGEEWTVRELRLELKAARRRKVIEGQAVLEGLYRVIYADPPWQYGDRPPSGKGAAEHYPAMTIAEICGLPVEAHATPDAVLFLWTTAPLLLQNPGPRDVLESWGFTYKTCRIWDKVAHGFGHYFEVRHELLIVATRGSCTPDRPTPMLPSVVTERRSDVHSEKPESFRRDIQRLYDGPYLELFGRVPIENWTVFGNDARLWAREAKGGTLCT